MFLRGLVSQLAYNVYYKKPQNTTMYKSTTYFTDIAINDIIHFSYGFEIGGKKYGWHEKKLWRLPYSENGRFYELNELKSQNNNGTHGYVINNKFLSLKAIKELTTNVDEEITIISKDCPF